jgi:hypothetical protein
MPPLPWFLALPLRALVAAYVAGCKAWGWLTGARD